jgi:hypothetical protein
MPIASSILWKPLRDSHYVVASLLRDGGGLREIFVRQSALRDVQRAVHSSADRAAIGLLLGARLDCALTLAPYVLVEEHVPVTPASLDERGISDAIEIARKHAIRHGPGEVLGWYFRNGTSDAVISAAHASIHVACFEERWQTVLAFGSSGNAGFFLQDRSASRWFHAPFYEVTSSKGGSLAPRPTCVDWPAYLTTFSVIPLAEPVAPVAPTPPTRTAPSTPAVSAPVQTPVFSPIPDPTGRRTPLPRPIVRTRRTPTATEVIEASRAAGRSLLALVKAAGSPVVKIGRRAGGGVRQIRADRAARAAHQQAEEEAARVRAEERRAKAIADRRAARAEAQRLAAEAQTRQAAEVQLAAETRRAEEARRVEAARLAAAAKAEETKRTDDLLRSLFDLDALLDYDAKRHRPTDNRGEPAGESS